MQHLQAIAAELTEKGYLANYIGQDSSVQGLYRIAITNPQLTKTIHLNAWDDKPHLLFFIQGKDKTSHDLTDPDSIPNILNQLSEILSDALEE